jgi:hypothetical protein
MQRPPVHQIDAHVWMEDNRQLEELREFKERTWDPYTRHVGRPDLVTDAEIYERQKEIMVDALREVSTEMYVLLGSLKLISSIIEKMMGFNSLSYVDAVREARAEFIARVRTM